MELLIKASTMFSQHHEYKSGNRPVLPFSSSLATSSDHPVILQYTLPNKVNA